MVLQIMIYAKNCSFLTIVDAAQVMCAAVISFVAGIFPAYAGEIHYGSIKEIKGERVLTLYKGPSEYKYFICNVRSGKCGSGSIEKPDFYPRIINTRKYANGPAGNYAVVELPTLKKGMKYHQYALYQLKQSKPKFVTILPIKEPASRIIFSPDEKVIAFILKNGKIAFYAIDKKVIHSIRVNEAKLSYYSLSYQGSYLAAYNYADETHTIWNVKTGEKFTFPGKSPGLVKFSDDERYAVLMGSVDGFPGLYIVNLGKFPRESSVEPLPRQQATVRDFVFIGNNLYYMSNEASAYQWSIFEYVINKDEKKTIAVEASYGSYMRRVDEKLAYPVVEGKNTNIALYDPLRKATLVLRPYPDSPVPQSIRRKEINVADLYAVLSYSEPQFEEPRPLFVWLHGGPERQASFSYHPFLSYAVYDELLDRVVLAGAYVLKVDYVGSYGYGNDFLHSLTNNIGIADVKSVVTVVNELKKNLNIDDIYLMGNSYGGYLGLRTLVDQPELFAGAIAINGVFDWFSLIERTKTSYFKKRFDGMPEVTDSGKNLEQYIAAGIYSRISNIKEQKVLLVLGERDRTVPTWQTKEFYYLLRSLNKVVELVTFPDENHILKKRKNLDYLCKKVLSTFSQSAAACMN